MRPKMFLHQLSEVLNKDIFSAGQAGDSIAIPRKYLYVDGRSNHAFWSLSIHGARRNEGLYRSKWLSCYIFEITK